MICDDPEIWVPVPGTNGMYDASTHGRVRAHVWRGKSVDDPVIVSQTTRKRDGYVQLRMNLEGVSRVVKLHQIICKTFHGKLPAGMQWDHIDDDKSNNRPDNFQKLTSQENIRKGRKKIVGKPRKGWLSPDTVLKIANSSEGWEALSVEHNVDWQTVLGIKGGRRYAKITGIKRKVSAEHAAPSPATAA